MRTILSIDDNEDILYTIQEICRSQGWNSLLARSFYEAEPILAQHGNGGLNLILVDYHLPQVDGVQAVRRIREMGIGVPIIVLTIEEQPAVLERFLQAGADDYSIKPIKMLDLVSRINTHLRYQQQSAANTGRDRGINQVTLDIIVSCLSEAADYMDVQDVERKTGLNAKTIHRYLLYLAQENRVETRNTYGKRGRPKALYRWQGA